MTAVSGESTRAIEDAFWSGLDQRLPVGDAEDLGIPSCRETLEDQINSGRTVGELLAKIEADARKYAQTGYMGEVLCGDHLSPLDSCDHGRNHRTASRR